MAEPALLIVGGALRRAISGDTLDVGDGILMGGDVALSRGAANRADLASGDSFNIVSGNLMMGATILFEADRDIAVNLRPNADVALDIGALGARFATIRGQILASNVAGDNNSRAQVGSATGGAQFSLGPGNAATNWFIDWQATGVAELGSGNALHVLGAGTFGVRNATGDANPLYDLSSAGLRGGAGGASVIDVTLARSAANQYAVIADPSSTAIPVDVLSLRRTTTGTAGNGLGAGLLFEGEVSDATVKTLGQIRMVWSDATVGTRTSRYIIRTLANAGSSTDRWQVEGAGHLWASADNAYDIGASGANRPRNVYLAGSLVGGGERYVNVTDGATPGDANYTVLAGDYAVLFTTALTAGRTLTLPDLATNRGRILVVKNHQAAAFNVTVTRAGADTIDGATTKVLAAREAVMLLAPETGTDWAIL